MKRFCVCAAVLTTCIFLISCVGCDSVSAVAKDKKNQLDKYLKDATVLPRANVQLEEARKSRAKLKEIADKFNVDAEVALRQIKRLEEEQAKSKKAFESLQDAAKKAGLPKRAEATSEDLEKKIQVGTKTLTGDDVYNTLKQFKAEVEKAGAAVKREKTKSDHLKKQSGGIKNKMDQVDANIDEMERKIEDYKMYQEMLAANKTIDDLGLDDDMIKQLLNTDTLTTALLFWIFWKNFTETAFLSMILSRIASNRFGKRLFGQVDFAGESLIDTFFASFSFSVGESKTSW